MVLVEVNKDCTSYRDLLIHFYFQFFFTASLSDHLFTTGRYTIRPTRMVTLTDILMPSLSVAVRVMVCQPGESEVMNNIEPVPSRLPSLSTQVNAESAITPSSVSQAVPSNLTNSPASNNWVGRRGLIRYDTPIARNGRVARVLVAIIRIILIDAHGELPGGPGQPVMDKDVFIHIIIAAER